MNIIVTGNNGLLGKSLTHKLLKNGHRVYGFSRHMAKDTVAVKHRNFKHIKVDLRRFKSVQDACNSIEDVKFIFHTATIHPAKNKKGISSYLDTNFKGAVNLLKACKERGFKNIIVSSSFSVYGKPEYLPIDERHPARPDNFYALTKLQADLLFEFYARKMGFHIIILRYDGIYGLGQTMPGFMQYLFESLLKDRDVILFNNGKQKRDNVYVDDVVEANLKAMRLIRKTNFDIFNIGGGKPRTSLERARITRRILKSKSKIILNNKTNPFFDYDIYLDISKARKVLGYRPTELDQNITKMIKEGKSDAETV